MSRTANLRRQHDAVEELVAEIVGLADTLEMPGVPYRVGMKLAKLTGLLRIHFVQEDKTLYPSMIRSDHAGASMTAAAFQDEMGGLSVAFEAFVRRWNSADRLAASPEHFRREARIIFASLARRIARENHELYPLADAIEDWQIPKTA